MDIEKQSQQVNQVPVSSSNATISTLSVNPKSKLPLILGVVLVLFLISGGAYYLGTQKNTHITRNVTLPPVNLTGLPKISPTQAMQIGYKIYTNTKYNFSFNYPSNLTPRKDATTEFIGFLEKPDENQSQKLVVMVTNNLQNLGIEQFVKKNRPIPYDWTDKSFENKTINGYEILVKRSERPCIGICQNTPLEKSFVTYVKGNKYIVSFSTDNKNSISDTKPDEDWLNPILYSFKITN